MKPGENQAMSKPNARCSKVGKVITVSDVKLVCGRVNRELSWILILKTATSTAIAAPVTITTTVAPTTTATTTTTVATTTTTTTTTVSAAIPKILSVAFRQPD